MVLAAGSAWWKWGGRLWSGQAKDLITQRAKIAVFEHDVTEHGEIESSSNVDVRCEVESKTTNGTAILEIVPEGTQVKKGDFLVKLNSSSLVTDQTIQQIAVNSATSAYAQATNEHEAAVEAKREYEQGTYKQEAEKLESELFVAQENFSRAEEYLRYSEKLAARGYITEIQLKADRFGVDKARKELDVAKTKLEVLREFTKPKTLKKLEADIKNAEAKMVSEQAKVTLESEKLALIESQITKCMITAPADGQVVYANEEDWRGNEDGNIKEGKLVRERQVIIRLPDPNKMQVQAKINESRIRLVKAGMKVRVKVDALPGVELEGVVKRVNEYALPTRWFSEAIKEYAAFVDIVNPPITLRPGMNAEVAIRVETLPKAVQVPVQAVFERNGEHYCILSSPEAALEARRVEIGSTDDKFVVIRSGLKGSERVVMDPRNHLEEVNLPAEKSRAKGTEVALVPAS